jgi:hypothetical protein
MRRNFRYQYEFFVEENQDIRTNLIITNILTRKPDYHEGSKEVKKD